MAKHVAVTNDIFWVGVNDRDTELFENIWPLPHGVAYNSYAVRDRQCVLVDAVKKGFSDEYASGIGEALGGRAPEYLIINHMEPDHSGAIRRLRELYPGVRLVGSAKTADFLRCFYGITDNVLTVGDGDVLETGRHKFRFFLAPMVHWPETMLTYDETERVLFSGDAFGGFGALDAGIFEDEVDAALFEEETRRYFSNIIGKYSAMVLKAIEKIKGLELAVVAPTHGPVYRRNPRHIISRYAFWSSYQSEPGVVVAYGSMYGNTQAMAEAAAHTLSEEGVREVRMHNVSKVHMSYIINDIWRFKGLVLAAPSYNTRLFPPMENLVRFLDNEGIKNRVIGLIACYGWSGGALQSLKNCVESLKLRPLEPVVEARCAAGDVELQRCRELARAMAAALREA